MTSTADRLQGLLACEGCKAFIARHTGAQVSAAAAAKQLLAENAITEEQYARLLAKDALYRDTSRHGYSPRKLALGLDSEANCERDPSTLSQSQGDDAFPAQVLPAPKIQCVAP